MTATHASVGGWGVFPNWRTFTDTGRHLYLQVVVVHISRAPHCDNLRAALGSELAASGQNCPRVAALHAGFLNASGWFANPLAASRTQRIIGFTTSFSAKTIRRSMVSAPKLSYGKGLPVLLPLLH
jgi:hypothetical protein